MATVEAATIPIVAIVRIAGIARIAMVRLFPFLSIALESSLTGRDYDSS
jgi:hypothetical protein